MLTQLMTEWLRTRRVRSPIAAALVCGIGLIVLHDQFVLLPVVLGTDGLALWTTFLPLVWAAGVADSFASKLQSAEIRPARRTLLLDTGLLLAMAGIGVAVFCALAGPYESGRGAAGHVLIMSGVACSFTLRGGAGAGVLAACALLIGTTFYGVDAPAGPYVRVLQPDGEQTWALVVGLGSCVAAGLLILINGAKVILLSTKRLDH